MTPKATRRGYSRPVIFMAIAFLACVILCVGVPIWSRIAFARATELRQTIRPGMSRSEVYKILDSIGLHYEIERPTHETGYCERGLPSIYETETAVFYSPLRILRDGTMYMCFDKSGILGFVE